MRLLCSVERQKQGPDFSIDKIQSELRSCRDSEAGSDVQLLELTMLNRYISTMNIMNGQFH